MKIKLKQLIKVETSHNLLKAMKAKISTKRLEFEVGF